MCGPYQLEHFHLSHRINLNPTELAAASSLLSMGRDVQTLNVGGCP